MKKLLTLSISILCLHSLSFSVYADQKQATENNEQALAVEAKAHIKKLAIALKSTLQHGMKTNGPAESVTLCNLQAPAITQMSSKKSGISEWTVSRTSLKPRSAANAPEEWAVQVMKKFEERKAQGEPVNKITYSEIRDGQYYFVKAIPTQTACLACHGRDIAEDVSANLADLYPNDQATGFNAGDIRGVFIATKKLEK